MCKGSSGPKGPSKEEKRKAEKREKELQKKLREQQKKQEKQLKKLQEKYNKQNKKLQSRLENFMGKQTEAMKPPSGDLFDAPSSYAQLLAALTQSMVAPPEKASLPRQDMPAGQHVEAPSAPAFIPPDSPGSGQTFSPEAPPAPPTAVQGDQVVIGPAGGQYTDIYNATHGTSALQIPLDKSIGTSGLNIPR